MHIAIIDCGTNTFHLLIAEVKNDGSVSFLLRQNYPVKLGEDGIDSGIIAEAAYQRGLQALKEFKTILGNFTISNTIAYATAAIRKAKNGNLFIADAKKLTGIKIEMIDGNREAELIYTGVKRAVKLKDEKVIIMDIGGGSVEFIVCNKNEIFWKHSFEIGAALLLEKFKPSDPVMENDIVRINNHLETTLQPLFSFIHHSPLTTHLIGSSGSFDTFAELESWQFFGKPLPEDIITESIDLEHYRQIHQQLIQSTADERIKMKGMIQMRVDMIVVASLLLTFVIEKLKIKTITLSSYALKEGILFSEW